MNKYENKYMQGSCSNFSNNAHLLHEQKTSNLQGYVALSCYKTTSNLRQCCKLKRTAVGAVSLYSPHCYTHKICSSCQIVLFCIIHQLHSLFFFTLTLFLCNLLFSNFCYLWTCLLLFYLSFLFQGRSPLLATELSRLPLCIKIFIKKNNHHLSFFTL